jgi:hypothetical protein
MSPVASRSVPITVGNTARAMPSELEEADYAAGAPLPGREPKPARPRTPLSLVVSTPRRTKTPLVVSLFLLLVAALSAVLIMSVSVSQGQYQLVDLKNQQNELAKTNQAMELDLGAQEAPQSLVARAAAMGMVPATTTGQIDVRTKKVTGNPQPAAAGTKSLVALPPADINQPVPAPAEPATKEEPAAAADTKAVAQAEKELAKAEKAAVPAAPQAAASELNGGTIPAPAQKDS